MRVATINNSMISKGQMRMEGKFFLNETSLLCMPLERNADKCVTLETVADVMNPPVFKRQFCSPTERAVQYFQSSDVNIASESSSVFVYKPQAERIKAIVHKGDILVTGFGTIGNARLISRHQDGVCYANNVARIRTKGEVLNGYIYAFMASKYGSAQLNKNASGSVVRYIEAPGIKKVLIPNTRVSFQQEVDDLIQKSARLREEATRLLETAKKLLSDYFNNDFASTSGCVTATRNIHDIRNSLQCRLDPPALMNNSVLMFEYLKDYCVELGSCNVNIYRPGIFKRCYVKEGLPYIKGSEIFSVNPFMRCDHLSRSKTPFVDLMKLREGQLLITCAGSVGQVKYITKEYEDKGAIGSQDIIRIESNDALFTAEYLFAYLQLPLANDYMQSMKYGSVIERIEPFHVESIPVVKPTQELSDEITALIKQYKDCTYRAFCAEEKAILIVEQEIESWTSSKKN